MLNNQRVPKRPYFLSSERIGQTSRNGNLRTIAAAHNEMNQALAPLATLYSESRIGGTSDSKEINRLSRLGVRDDPNLEV
jgi:hypothetical protein